MNRVVHLVSNAHIDPIWQWQWEEGAIEALSTFRTAVTFLESYPDYVFIHNESLLYEWVEEYDPDMFEMIKRFVRDGRWIIVGGWYVQPDCNIPGGESFVRQALIGKRYFMEKFGVEPLTAYNVDSFGHNGGLPQILNGSGYKYYLHFRPTKADEPDLPHGMYVWKGVDGSEILACRPAIGHYVTEFEEAVEKTEQGIAFARENGRDCMVFWGVGDHGGGATKADLDALQTLIESTGDVEVRHSDPETYFNAVCTHRDSFPVLEGDVQKCFTGCYTSAARIKRAHRQAEGVIAQAERLAALADCYAGMQYPQSELETAWKDLLFNQFHDVLAGSSSEAGTQDGIDIFGRCTMTARKVRLRAALALAALYPPQEEGIPVYVFNPHSFEYRGAVEVDFMTGYRPDFDNKLSFDVADRSGEVIPSQEETPTSRLPFEWRRRIVFDAVVPPMGCERYMIRRNQESDAAVTSGVRVSSNDDRLIVDTGRIRAEFGLETGILRSLKDMEKNLEILRGEGLSLLVMDDPGDCWGTEIDSYDKVIGRFGKADGATLVHLAGQDSAGVSTPSVRVVEDGPVRTTVESVLQYGRSTAVLKFVFYPGNPYFEITLRITWNETRKMLKLSVPTALTGADVTCEIPYGAIERDADGVEKVGQRWTILGSNGYAFGLINTGQYGFDVKDGEVRLSLLRSPVFCHGKRVTLEDDRTHVFMDMGEHEIKLAVVLGDGETAQAETIKAANRLNVPAFVMPYFPAGPGNPVSGNPCTAPEPFVEVSPETVVLGALKKAEDGNGYIVRIHESAGKQTDVSLSCSLADKQLSFAMRPYQLKSFRIIGSGDITEVDLLEREIH